MKRNNQKGEVGARREEKREKVEENLAGREREKEMIGERAEEGRGWRKGQRCDKEEGRDQRAKWKLGGLHNAAGVSNLSQWDLTP